MDFYNASDELDNPKDPVKYLEGLALLETFQDIARAHVWVCQMTEAVHLSRFLLFVMVSLQASQWLSIPNYLVDFARENGPQAAQTCSCYMPEGLVSPCPPPWANRSIASPWS